MHCVIVVFIKPCNELTSAMIAIDEEEEEEGRRRKKKESLNEKKTGALAPPALALDLIEEGC